MNIRKTFASFAVCAVSFAVVLPPAKAQTIDLHKRPEASLVKEVPFPKYEEVKLKNGMRLLIIEDHEQPTFSLRMQLIPGTTADGDKPGLATLALNLLPKGTSSRSALDIAKALDGLGASINTSAAGDAMTVSASGLKKHLPTILGIYADVLMNPAFANDEVEKMRTQAIEGVRYEKSEAGPLVQALARKTVYGENHPYAMKESEESLKSISVEDIKKFHSSYFKPNNAYLAIVGDVTKSEIVPMLEKAFANWKSGTTPTVKLPPIKPMPKGVYFIERPSSVQSSFVITGPSVPYSDPNFETVSLAADVIGSGFGGRLFRTLRETYSYTYTPFGFVTRAKEANRFVAGADVRNAVTDSAIIVTKTELEKLTKEPPSKEDLYRLQRYTVGSFLMSFENTDYLASLLQLAELNNIPFSRVKSYPARIMAITPADIQKTAAQYMNPANMSVVVVGSREVLSDLEKFGSIYQYNLNIEPVRVAAMEAVSMSADELVAKHIAAIGGNDAVKSLKSLTTNSEVVLSAGPQSFKGKGVTKHKTPGKTSSMMDITVMKQQRWVNGNKAWESANGSPAAELTGQELEDAMYNAYIVPMASLKDMGYTLRIEGKQGDSYILKAKSTLGNEKTFYIDANTMLVTKVEYLAESEQGTMPVTEEYSDYVPVAGVKLPKNMTVTMGPGITVKTTNTFEANPTIDDKDFLPPQGK